MRVQIPAYTDHWMKGDRYGVVTSAYLKKTCGTRVAPNTVIAGPRVEIARVKLDISKKTISVLLSDCTEV